MIDNLPEKRKKFPSYIFKYGVNIVKHFSFLIMKRESLILSQVYMHEITCRRMMYVRSEWSIKIKKCMKFDDSKLFISYNNPIKYIFKNIINMINNNSKYKIRVELCIVLIKVRYRLNIKSGMF